MRHIGKFLGLLGTFGLSGLYSFTVNANVTTNPNELYSESIYIQKSSAEVPTSLESNARPKKSHFSMAAEDAPKPQDESLSVSDLDASGDRKVQ